MKNKLLQNGAVKDNGSYSDGIQVGKWEFSMTMETKKWKLTYKKG